MQKIKIFKELSLNEMETEMNKWIEDECGEKNDIHIQSITNSIHKKTQFGKPDIKEGAPIKIIETPIIIVLYSKFLKP
jgi:hypothetical protein